MPSSCFAMKTMEITNRVCRDGAALPGARPEPPNDKVR